MSPDELTQVRDQCGDEAESARGEREMFGCDIFEADDLGGAGTEDELCAAAVEELDVGEEERGDIGGERWDAGDEFEVRGEAAEADDSRRREEEGLCLNGCGANFLAR